MGLLVDGVWQDQWYDTKSTGGRFKRKESSFRSWVTEDGSAGPTGEGGFKAEPNRYHLYISYACPWAHRTLILRALKGLEDMISLSVVHWYMAEEGWTFEPGRDVIGDPFNNASRLHQVYTAAKADYTGRVTVPILWDKKTNTIVSNESSEILRMFNSAFDAVGAKQGDYYPGALRTEIDEVNTRVYGTLNNGVYKCGFATTQEAYEENVYPLFETLDWLEERLEGKTYLVGDQLTEADIRTVVTLFRFDPVYVQHFKCNLKRIYDYPNLWDYTRALYQHPAIKPTVNHFHIKHHYLESHETINPHRIVPAGPIIDWDAPTQRQIG